jgi:Tol biopolymer transport system component
VKYLDTGKVEQLTNDGFNTDPVWALDGKSIYFTRSSKEDQGNVNLYSLVMDTRELQQLTQLKGVCGDPYIIAPNSIYFWHNAVGKPEQTQSLDLSTKMLVLQTGKSEIKSIAKSVALKISETKGRVEYNPTLIYSGFQINEQEKIIYELDRVRGLLGSPSWSPDNTLLAYQNAPDIHILDVQTKKTEILTELHEGKNRYFDYSGNKPFWSDPRWVADGKYILGTLYKDGTDKVGELYFIDIKTKERIFLVKGHKGNWTR